MEDILSKIMYEFLPKGSVVVRDDGSGSIDVSDVGGDFAVEHDGSGGITHDGVRGTVRIPRRR